MFVYSVNRRQLKFFGIILCLLAMGIILAFLTKDSISAANTGEKSLKASTAEERIAFLSQYGWSVDEEPLEVKEIIIPAEFDDVYESYNAIQTEQGFDLTAYCSKRVKKWTYKVTNYPGYEDSDCIRATLLVFDGQVIGGDVCSVELDGFMHGFVSPVNNSQ